VTGSDRVVTTMSVRLRRSKGTGALVVRLETSGGSLIEAVNVPAASIPVSIPGGDTGGAVWVTATFQSSHTLVNGSSYNLRLSTDGITTYTLFTIRKGIEYDFADNTYFKDGSAFKTTNGSTWSNLGRVTLNPPENDIEFSISQRDVRHLQTQDQHRLGSELSSLQPVAHDENRQLQLKTTKESTLGRS